MLPEVASISISMKKKSPPSDARLTKPILYLTPLSDCWPSREGSAKFLAVTDLAVTNAGTCVKYVPIDQFCEEPDDI